jgi:L-fuculose-phosphate aldolase
MGISRELLEDFRLVGRFTCEMGLNSSHSGNLSVRRDDRMIITCTLAMLGNLNEDDLVEVPLKGEVDPGFQASKEVITHRAIYDRTDARAIVHTHPINATTLSLLFGAIVPIDIDGAYHFPRVDVVAPDHTKSPEAVAEVVAGALEGTSIVLSRGHGAFAAEESLQRALQFSCVLESSARIIYRLMTLGKDPSVFEKDYFGKWKGVRHA